MPINTIDHPVCLVFSLIFEFYLNDDEEEKARTINRIIKEGQKKFNVSITSIQDSLISNPERGVIIGSLCAKNKFILGEQKNRILAFFDQEMPARIISEDYQTIDIS